MTDVSQSTLRAYQNKAAIREVLGCIINDPTLLKVYKISPSDFVEAFHKVVLVGAHNLISMGVNKIDAYSIEEYLKDAFPTKYIIFKRNDGVKYIERATELSTPENFVANYTELKKYSLLRDVLVQGFDVSDFFDPEEIDPDKCDVKREFFESHSVDDMLDYFKRKVLDVSNKYSMKEGRDSIKAGGEEAYEQIEKWKSTPDFGLSYASQYFNAVTRGLRKKRLVMGSAASGTGKSRLSVANLCFSFVPKVYNSETKTWDVNPHGTQNAGLYIGTEMELREEVEPILEAYIAKVPEQHIRDGAYEPGEEERVKEAIRILTEEANIYMEYIPDYDIATLERIIDEQCTRHHIDAVFFDYVHTTTNLISEFQGNAKARMAIREDQVLANLGLKLKELTRKYNVSIDTWTQVSGDIKNEQNRDQSVVRGAKALVDKIDTGFVASRPTIKELKLLEPITRNLLAKKGVGTIPNLCYSVYKNRGGKLNNVKIWQYVDYDTMRVHDLFMTDNEYQLLPVSKLYIGVNENAKVITSDNTDDLNKKLIEGRVEINAIEDDGGTDALKEIEEIEEIEEQNDKDKENKKNSSVSQVEEFQLDNIPDEAPQEEVIEEKPVEIKRDEMVDISSIQEATQKEIEETNKEKEKLNQKELNKEETSIDSKEKKKDNAKIADPAFCD